jgi:hypothetical protein
MRFAIILRFTGLALAASLISAGAIAAEPAQRFKDVPKFAVAYDDALLGRVEGVAFCDWDRPRCHVKLRDPATPEPRSLEAEGLSEIKLPGKEPDPVVITLRGHSPSSIAVTMPPLAWRGLGGDDGAKGKLTIAHDRTSVDHEIEARASATADLDRVRLELDPLDDGSLLGHWSYLANPITQRDADGSGRVGFFQMLSDTEIPVAIKDGVPQRPGGFLGMQKGGEVWQPLPPHVYKVFPLEDQAGYDGQIPKFRHAWSSKQDVAENMRRLVVIGRDLPVDDDRAVVAILSKDAALSYELIAVAGSKSIKEEDAQQFERVWREITGKMSADDAASFRKLEAVMLKVTLTRAADPGPKLFTWAGASGEWPLQYGDNTADVRFSRVFNEKESEIVTQFALPERVVVEVETGSPLNVASIPVRVGGAALSGDPIELIATRVPGSDFLYRTAPLVVAEAGGAAPPAAGATVVAVRKGSRLLAGVNREKTNFLRASAASALASEPSSMWVNALRLAGSCVGQAFTDWPAFARKPAQAITLKRQSVDINFGDHAAMLILRDEFLRVMRQQLKELVVADTDDALIDAWYRNMHDAVTKVPYYPLATVLVPAPEGGETYFIRTYSHDYAVAAFKLDTTADGVERYLSWRRKASRLALAEYRRSIGDALAEAEKIGDCDREALLKLTGAGFDSIYARLAPYLMKFQPDEGLVVPDRLARAYVKSLDVLAARLQAMEAFSSEVNKAIVAGVTAIVALPAMVWGGATGAMIVYVGGLATYSVESGYQIYETYRQHEELNFEFGYSAALGLERYFDAQSRKSEWWTVGLSIFGQGLLQATMLPGVLHGIESEGMAVWRGSRLATSNMLVNGRLTTMRLPTVRALPEGSQRDLAMYLLKEQEQAANSGVFGYRARYAFRAFKGLGDEAAGQAVIEGAAPLAQKLEAQAAAEADEVLAATRVAPDPAQVAKAELAEVSLAREAELDASEAMALRQGETEPGVSLAGADAIEFAKKRGYVLYDGLPLPGRPFQVTIGGKPVTLELGEFVGQGEFFTAFRLKQIPPELNVRPGLGDDLVIKFFNKNNPSLAKAEKGAIPGITKNVIARMKSARDLLKRGRIHQLDFDAFEDAGIVIQTRVKSEPGKFRMFGSKDFMEIRNAENAHLREALGKLYRQLGDNKLIWMDGHIKNVFFEFRDGEWVAGVLDQDFICRFDEVTEGVYGAYLSSWQQGSPAWSTFIPGDLAYSTPQSFLLKFMEQKQLIGFDPVRKGYYKKLLDPDELRKILGELPYRTVADPKALKGGWLIEPAKISPRAFANDNATEGEACGAGAGFVPLCRAA